MQVGHHRLAGHQQASRLVHACRLGGEGVGIGGVGSTVVRVGRRGFQQHDRHAEVVALRWKTPHRPVALRVIHPLSYVRGHLTGVQPQYVLCCCHQELELRACPRRADGYRIQFGFQ